jgi:hypothetical protein
LARSAQPRFVVVLETVQSPHSLFEQFQGLWLADAMLPDLDPLQERLLIDAVRRARRKRRFKRDGPLMALSHSLLERLRERTFDD